MALTLTQLATHKKLPPQLLASLGLAQQGKVIEIPYYGLDGALLYKRRRLGLSGSRDTRQPAGVPLVPYGLWRLPEARELGYLVCVEGESDCWTLWHHDCPALGLPGSGTTGCLQAAHLEGLRELYAVQEPDAGGRRFVDGLAERLTELHWQGDFWVISLAPHKDVSEVHCKAPRLFSASFDRAMADAQARELPPPPSSNGNGFHGPESAFPGPPIPLSESCQPPPFPVHCLPPPLRTFCTEVAMAKDAPVDYVATPLLTVAGGAIGASRALRIKDGWAERPLLYTAVVAPPSSGKSPCLRDVAAPAYGEQRRLHEHFRRQRIDWEEDQEERKRPGGKAVRALPRPSPQACYVDDITVETLAPLLVDNPRGVVSLQDELLFLLGGMNQYKPKGRGNDRQFWCKAWSGESVLVHRKHQEDGPILVPHPFVGVAGNLCPSGLASLADERAGDDGYLDRWLFSYAIPLPMEGEDWIAVTREVETGWWHTWRTLRTLEGEKEEDGSPRPRYLRLNGQGRRSWERWTAALASEVNVDSFPDYLKGPWGKFRRYVPRLALILHCLWTIDAAGPCDDVGGECVDLAGELASYFQAHARRVYAALDADPRVQVARRVLDWLARRPGQPAFRRADCYRDLRHSLKKPEALDGPLDLLVQHRYLCEVAEPEQLGNKVGRKSTSTYRVSPLWERPKIHEIHETTLQGN